MWDRDFTTEIDLDDGTGCITAPAVFSTWIGHPDDLPALTLETVKLGNLQLSRTQMVDWLGETEVKRIEVHKDRLITTMRVGDKLSVRRWK